MAIRAATAFSYLLDAKLLAGIPHLPTGRTLCPSPTLITTAGAMLCLSRRLSLSGTMGIVAIGDHSAEWLLWPRSSLMPTATGSTSAIPAVQRVLNERQVFSIKQSKEPTRHGNAEL